MDERFGFPSSSFDMFTFGSSSARCSATLPEGASEVNTNCVVGSVRVVWLRGQLH